MENEKLFLINITMGKARYEYQNFKSTLSNKPELSIKIIIFKVPLN